MDERHLLQKVLESAALSHDACASALGISRQIFEEMLAGQREIPRSIVPLMAATLGVDESLFTDTAKPQRSCDHVPAIWYKLRAEGLTDADREYVLAVRQLAFHQHELEEVTDTRSVGWKTLFEELRRETNPQASPTEQGRQAARFFRRATGLDQGAIGIGEVFRGHLRNIGVLVTETPAPESVLDGCSFYVGPSGAERPSIFANAYRTTWFRRNRILLHELAHAIFDVESAIAALDRSNKPSSDRLQEDRADSFAQECLVPPEVLRHFVSKRGIKLASIDAATLAEFIAATHVEQRLLVKALLDAELIDSAKAEALEAVDVAADLRRISEHALSTEEYLKKDLRREAWIKGRTTTTSARKLLLPSRFVGAVLDSFKAQIISRGKAARMLMIDEYEFVERFPDLQPVYDD